MTKLEVDVDRLKGAIASADLAKKALQKFEDDLLLLFDLQTAASVYMGGAKEVSGALPSSLVAEDLRDRFNGVGRVSKEEWRKLYAYARLMAEQYRKEGKEVPAKFSAAPRFRDWSNKELEEALK